MTKEELKQEATEYALEWGDKTDGTYASCRDGYIAGAEPREERIAALETRCAELFLQNNEFAEQLTKAKELKQLLQDIIVSSGSDREELIKEAEQFLKEDK